jgi:hypothetical protein
MNQIVSEWGAFVSRLGQEIAELGDIGDPVRVNAEGDPLDADLFLDTLHELEQRGLRPENVVAVTSPNQLVALLDRLDAAARVPATDLNDEGDPPLPEDATIYGVSLRVEPGFPNQNLVMFPPESVTFEGKAVYPNHVAVVESLQEPDLDGSETFDLERVLSELVSVAGVEESVVEVVYENDGDDEGDDPDRKGDTFVADGGYEPPGGEPWVVALGMDGDGDLVVQAVTENVDLDGVDALEHRFYAVDAPNAVREDGTDAGASPALVYGGVMVHNHGDEEDGDEDACICELYAPGGLDVEAESVEGRASVDDLPASIRERVSEAIGADLFDPADLPEFDDEGDDLLGPEAFGLPNPRGGDSLPDTEPRGFQ